MFEQSFRNIGNRPIENRFPGRSEKKHFEKYKVGAFVETAGAVIIKDAVGALTKTSVFKNPEGIT